MSKKVKKVRQPKEVVGADGLTPGTRKLLDELVEDLGNPGLPPRKGSLKRSQPLRIFTIF